MVAGGLVGGFCGFVTYWVGAFIVALDDLVGKPATALPHEFSRPFLYFTYWEIVLVALGMLIGAAVGRYRWRLAGVLGFVGLVSITGGYLAYALAVSIPRVPADERWLSYALVGAESAGLALVVMSAFYSLDVATRRTWLRRPADHAYDPALRPKVAFQVPVFNEPPQMVEQTIAHLLRQDYPRGLFDVYVADDSTDPRIRERLKAYCGRNGAIHVTRPDRRGFKAGALNHVTRILPPDVKLVSVIDADYWVAPDFLKAMVGHFTDTSIAFIQTPQDYRNGDESFLTRQYKRAEAYFYHAVMPSRNEENAIIFCGTMGILRRTALEEVGGFAEDQICEDAELSVRLVAAGWTSLYVDEGYGKGLMPATFEAYKKQFHRWAFGNVRILFTRAGTILRSRMRRRQKIDYLSSNLHWFDGFVVLAIAAVLTALALGPLLGYDLETHHQQELVLLSIVPVLLLIDSMVRLRLVLGRAGHRRLRDAFLVQGMWFAIKTTTLMAVVKCMLGFRSPFVRTPKDPQGRLNMPRAFGRAVRVTWFECLLGTGMLVVGVLNAVMSGGPMPGRVLLPLWLGVYGLFFLCAPIYAYLSYRTLREVRFHLVPPVSGPADQVESILRSARSKG